MTVVTGIVFYCIVWCVVFFLVNPFWQVSQRESGGEIVPGTPESAPVNAHMKRKVIITSVVAAVVVVLTYLGLESGILSLDRFPGLTPPGWE